MSSLHFDREEFSSTLPFTLSSSSSAPASSFLLSYFSNFIVFYLKLSRLIHNSMSDPTSSKESAPAYKLTIPLGFSRNRDLSKARVSSQGISADKCDAAKDHSKTEVTMPSTPTKHSGALSPTEFFTPKSQADEDNSTAIGNGELSTKFADLVIVCGKDRYEVHKVILCSQVSMSAILSLRSANVVQSLPTSIACARATSRKPSRMSSTCLMNHHMWFKRC